MSYEESLIQLVDQRVRLNQQQTRALGTCIERNTTGPGCTVLFDGSTVAVPVKTLGHVMLSPGDRCALERFGTEWLVVGAFNGPALGVAGLYGLCPITVTTTSASFADIALTGAPFTFTKKRDRTWVRINQGVGALITGTAATELEWAIRLTLIEGDTAYTPVDIAGPFHHFNELNVHDVAFSSRDTPGTSDGSGIPAGVYSVAVRWRRTQGTGTGSTDINDLYSLTMQEFVHSSTPDV